MKPQNAQPPILFTLLVIALPLTLVFLAGCLKMPEAKVDFGSEFSLKSVEAALGQMKTTSPLNIQKGEFVYTETSLRIENQPSEVTRQEAMTVVDRKDSDSEIFLAVVRNLVEGSQGNSKPSKTEIQVVVPKNPKRTIAAATLGLAQTDSAFKPFSFIHALQSPSFSMKASQRRVSFHNLKTSNIQIPVPLLVQIRENCGGLGPVRCSEGLSAVRVSLDQVVWDGNSASRTSFIWITSPDVPYLSGQILSCARSLIPYQGARYNILQCDEVKDFVVGTAAQAVAP